MTTRFDRQGRGRERGDQTVEGLNAGVARLVALKLPYDVRGAQNFKMLQEWTQMNLEALVQQAEREINRVGRFIGEDGYPTINKDEYFSKARVGADT